MTYGHDALSEREAKELWERAARLQYEAQKQAEEQVRHALPDSDDSETVTYDVALQAALDSGIDETHVRQAALELRLQDQLDRHAVAQWHIKALGFAEKTVSERVRVPASAAAVRSVIGQLVSGPAFESEPVDIVEFDERTTALVYEVPKVPSQYKASVMQAFDTESFHYNVRHVAEIKRYAIIIAEQHNAGTEITVHTSLDRSVRINAIALRIIQAITVPVAAGLGALGAGILVSSFAPALVAGPVLVGLAGAAAAIGAGFGITALYRRAYNKAFKRVKESFHKMLTTLRMQVG
ncbi:MAG: hypothetical protein ACOC4I_00780 [Spirochaetota bacterium]